MKYFVDREIPWEIERNEYPYVEISMSSEYLDELLSQNPARYVLSKDKTTVYAVFFIGYK
jgi:hypothetical protein